MDSIVKDVWIAASSQCQQWREQANKLVFTNGCFDLLHPGHMDYLQAARALGDRLIVGLNTDDSIRALKGCQRPINPLVDREAMLAAVRWVDCVVPFSDDTPLSLICCLRPDVLVKGGDYVVADIVGAPEVIAWGGDVLTIPFKEGYSSSRLIQKIAGLNAT